MNETAFRKLVVVRDQSVEVGDKDHVALRVQSSEPRAVTYEGAGLAGFDPANIEHWHQLGAIAVDNAGTLARIVSKVAPSLQVGAMRHRCQWRPDDWTDDGDELPNGAFIGGCRYGLSSSFGGLSVETGRLPLATVWVPRNRERSWTEYLAGQITRAASVDLEALTVTQARLDAEWPREQHDPR